MEDEAYAKLEPKQKREKTFEAFRDLMVSGSQERPLILAVEDLHWIDKTSEEFLNYMIGWLPNTHILLILLYRPEYTHTWGSKSYYSKIGVDQLSRDTSAELVQSHSGRRRCDARTEGSDPEQGFGKSLLHGRVDAQPVGERLHSQER